MTVTIMTKISTITFKVNDFDRMVIGIALVLHSCSWSCAVVLRLGSAGDQVGPGVGRTTEYCVLQKNIKNVYIYCANTLCSNVKTIDRTYAFWFGWSGLLVTRPRARAAATEL